MKILAPCALSLSALALGAHLATEYKADRALRVEVQTTLKMETTTMERDGQPVETPGGGRMAGELTRKEVHVDRVVEASKGEPSKVRRTFEEVGGTSSTTFGDNTRDTEIESPLKGVTLEIARDAEGQLDVTVAEGAKPDDEKALEGHLPELFLDALLPSGDVEADAKWDLDKDAIRRALRLDVERALFAPPAAPAEAEGGGGGGGRRGGFRSMGGGDAALLSRAEWKGQAKLAALDEDVDGKTCAVIELEIEASGDLPEQPRGQGGPRRRDGAPESAGALRPRAGNTYEIKLEGKLVFDTKGKRPVLLDLEGTVKTESEREFTRNETTSRMRTVREGTLAYKVEVAEAEGDK